MEVNRGEECMYFLRNVVTCPIPYCRRLNSIHFLSFMLNRPIQIRKRPTRPNILQKRWKKAPMRHTYRMYVDLLFLPRYCHAKRVNVQEERIIKLLKIYILAGLAYRTPCTFIIIKECQPNKRHDEWQSLW